MDDIASQLIVKIQAGKACISLNRPPANSYYYDYLKHILKTIEEINQHKSIKVVLIDSTSDKFFCGGADIKIFSTNNTGQNAQMVEAAREVTSAIAGSDKIFVAAISGHVLGGGLEIAMACDIRLASEGDYLVGLPEVKHGLMPGNGGVPRLIDLIGAGRAMEMLITGKSISPLQAYDFGLFNQLYPSDEFDKKVGAYLDNLAEGPGQAMSAIKKYVQQYRGMDMQQTQDFETECVKTLYNTPDAVEGFKAFVEKRAPKFK